MIAADVDTPVAIAFAVGFISFVSPCVLPLVPGYLSTISGVSFADLQEGRGRRTVVGPALLFCLSFTIMFVALGMSATGLGSVLQENRLLLRQIAWLPCTGPTLGAILTAAGTEASFGEGACCWASTPSGWRCPSC